MISLSVSRHVPLGLCFLLLFHGCLAQLSPLRKQPQYSPLGKPQQCLRGRSECQIDQITAREPNRVLVSEAGVSEFWDSFGDDELECAGVEAVRHTINPKGLLLPYYPSAPELVYVVRGKGLQGTVLPGCPETFETSFESEGGRGQFFDKHQRVYRYKEGDILALPAGTVHWTYNDGDTPIVTIVLRDISNVANQLDSNFRKFFLAGNPQSMQLQQGSRVPGHKGSSGSQGSSWQPDEEGSEYPSWQPGTGYPGSWSPGQVRPGSWSPDKRQPGSWQPGTQPWSKRPSEQPWSKRPSEQPWSTQPGSWQPGTQPWSKRPSEQPWSTQPGTGSKRPSEQPWSTQPESGSKRPSEQPWSTQPGTGSKRPSEQPWSTQPGTGSKRPSEQPWSTQPGTGSKRPSEQPWSTQPGTGSKRPSEQPWSTQPGSGSKRPSEQPWSTQPGSGPKRPSEQPWSTQPGSGSKRPSEQPWSTQPGSESKHPSEQPWSTQPGTGSKRPSEQPWSTQPGTGSKRPSEQPWSTQPGIGSKRPSEQPWSTQPGTGSKYPSEQPWSTQPDTGSKRPSEQPWSTQPSTGSKRPSDQPWSTQPSTGSKRPSEQPWSTQPGSGSKRPSEQPWSTKPDTGSQPWSTQPGSWQPGTHPESKHPSEQPWSTQPGSTSPFGRPGQPPRKEGEPSYKPWEYPGQEEGEHGYGGKQEDPCEVCRRIKGERGETEPCANCNDLWSQEEQGQQDYNIFSGFDDIILEEIFKVESDTIRKLQGVYDDRGLIVKAENFQVLVPEEQEQQKSSQGGGSGLGRANGIEQTLCSTQLSANIASPVRADVYNPRGGRISNLNSHKLPVLNTLQLSAERGVLYKNAVLAPHYNLNAHSIIYVTSGSSRLQIVKNNGTPVFDDIVREGQLIVVPQDFAVIKKAGDEGCEWVAFKTNDNAITTQLAGRFSFIRALPEEVLLNSYDISREQAKSLKYSRQEGVILSPRSESTTKKAKNALLTALFG